MRKMSLSLWLPVSRANFYSFAARDWLIRHRTDDHLVCRSARLDDPGYVPLLQAPVLRRLLEVMPRSFGYGREGTCGFSDGVAEERLRPNSVELTLDLSSRTDRDEDSPERRANQGLVAAGVAAVVLRADENGFYTFTASFGDSSEDGTVQAVLQAHIREVFGGGYYVHPLRAREKRRHNAGDAAVKQYNGLADKDGSELVVGPPLGALNFFQLNTLAEGLWNDMLSPAIYLEQEDFMTEWLRGPEKAGLLRTVGDVVAALVTDTDASKPAGQIVALHHFLTMTAHGSLQKLKYSLESVRRRLLDEMMGALHRQSRLVQLNFSANARERTPELATGATEAQLRGYASLVAAKLPLIITVREVVRLAREHLEWLVKGPDSKNRPEEESTSLAVQLWRLDGQLDHWKMLLKDLTENVHNLDTSIEHAWMERLLYEQVQARSEQEAMAEIERSRHSRPVAEGAGRSAYNMVMLVLAAAAVVFTVASNDLQALGRPETSWWKIFIALWPVWTLAIIAYGVVPAVGHVRRAGKERRGILGSYPYEFAFRLDEPVEPEMVQAHLSSLRRRTLRGDKLARVSVTNRGYGRIERVSPDTTLLKTHSVAGFSTGRFRYARFEIITEILTHKIANNTQHVLVQCRMFGESPRPLSAAEVMELVQMALSYIGTELTADGAIDAMNILEDSIYRPS